jgi:hypothetical protein
VIEQQYRPHAYVCGKACVKRIGDDVGTVAFSWIYQRRPIDCRYAVAGTWSGVAHSEAVHVFDLYNVMKNFDGSLIVPAPIATHSDVDAAIMETAMLYEEGS